MKKKIKQLYAFLRRENVLKLLGVIVFLILISGYLVSLFEPSISFTAGIWWSVVTLTTVGYGDISPTTFGGRILAIIIMFFGIGLLGVLSASLASMLINMRIREDKGMVTSNLRQHIIICEWNHRARTVLRELRANAATMERPVALIADIDEKPLADPQLVFIRGVVNEESLEKANLAAADSIIILGDDTIEPTARDAKVVLTALTAESINPAVYSVVELNDKVNEQHCLRANVDEVIIGSELNSRLLASAACDHGISRIISELLSSRYGNEIFSMQMPEKLVGHSFLEAFIAMKKEHDAIVFGVQKGKGGEVISNPEGEYLLCEGDYLLVISKDRK